MKKPYFNNYELFVIAYAVFNRRLHLKWNSKNGKLL